MNHNRIKLSQLRDLVAVVEYGNFSEAALHLNISQSAVSHAIACLEAELGVLLLARGRSGAHLTPAGEAVIGYAQQALQLSEKMVEVANSHRGLEGGQVRIATFRSAATHLLPEIVARFRQQFPQIAVNIIEHYDTWEVNRAVHEGRADIGLLVLPATQEFETWEILRDEYVALLPPTASVSGSQVTWRELAVYPLISETPGSSCYVRLHHYLRSCGVSLNSAYEIRENSTMVSMVAQGLGVSILPRLSAEPIPAEVKVCQLPVPLERVIAAAVLADALHSPAVYAFLDALKGNRLADATY